MSEMQCATDVLMIRPASFCGNVQTAESNRFQNPQYPSEGAQSKARIEFDSLAKMLLDAGVRVHVFDDTSDPQTPDAIFPNNWVSFHSDGTAVVYPMLAANRRLERRADILEALSTHSGFQIRRVVDLAHRETEEQFLEGTGSLVLDRVNRVAYACLSPRTHLDVLGEFSQVLDYEVVAFEAADRDGHAIYHTNVMLSVGAHYAAICVDAIREDQRAGVLDSLRTTRHHLLELSYEQMNAFAGNMLELGTTKHSNVVAMSGGAQNSLTVSQREQLQAWAGPIVASPIPTIETIGGGSVRCMLAEIHLPRGRS